MQRSPSYGCRWCAQVAENAARCGIALSAGVHTNGEVCQSGAASRAAERLGEPADGLVGVAVAGDALGGPAVGVEHGRVGAAAERPPDRRAASGRSVRARGTWRAGAARRRRRRGWGRRAPRPRCRTRPRSARWISLDGRAAPGSACGIEAGEDLVGELGGDRPAGERAEGHDADQRALERADVVGDAVGDELERAGVERADRRPAATRLRRIVRRVAKSGARTSVTSPASKRSRRRASMSPRSRGRRSEVRTIWAPAWCSALKVWKNSSSVRALAWRNWTSSTSRTSTPR